MITDRIENVKIYSQIPKIAQDFILSLDKNFSVGKHILSEDIYANIEEYNTKLLENAKFETHDKYIDIQILLSGKETIALDNRDILTVSEPYDEKRDITFYSDKISQERGITLDGTNFVMIFPHEAHAPQISIDEKTEKVLKVVVKIKI